MVATIMVATIMVATTMFATTMFTYVELQRLHHPQDADDQSTFSGTIGATHN